MHLEENTSRFKSESRYRNKQLLRVYAKEQKPDTKGAGNVELWDIYDACYQKTGRLHERGKILQPGDYHLVVHIFPVNDKKEILVQKRSDTVKRFPGCWAVTGGSAIAGEDSWEACQRELQEELGIVAEKKDSELAAVFKRIDSFNSVWVIRCNLKREQLILQKEEVAEAAWLDFPSIHAMAKQGILHKYPYLDWLGHYIDLIKWE